MEERDIQQRLHLLEKQIESTVSLFEETRLDLVAAVDALKIEIATLKTFIARRDPEFERVYPMLKQEVIEKTDPEWPENKEQR